MRTYTWHMNLAKAFVDIATTPARIGLAAADAGIDIAEAAIDIARRSLGDATTISAGESVAHLLGLEETIDH